MKRFGLLTLFIWWLSASYLFQLLESRQGRFSVIEFLIYLVPGCLVAIIAADRDSAYRG